MKNGAGLFTLLPGKHLRFPGCTSLRSASLDVPASSARLSFWRCIDDTAPDDFGPERRLVIISPGWECRGVPQAEVRLCGTGVPGCPGALRCPRGTLQARPLPQAGRDQLLRAQGQDLQTHPPQTLLQEEVLAPRHGLRSPRVLRDRSGRLPRRLAANLRSALSDLQVVL